MRLWRTAIAALAVAVALVASNGGSPVRSAPAAAASINPYGGDESARRAGAKLYARECAACHGVNREGRAGVPPLDQPEVHEASPGTLFWVLRNGSLRHGMPSFAHLPEAQRWQIITFLQSKTTH